MTRKSIPLQVDDLSHFSRALARQLGEASPPHLTLMNMLARAAGFQNLQHQRAVQAAAGRLAQANTAPSADHRLIERTLTQFDASGRLLRWPSRRAVQTLALFGLWAVFPPDTPMPETEVNRLLLAEHEFEDPATLRRTMISCGLLTRQRDGSNYRRIEQEPPTEAKALISRLSARRKQRSALATAGPEGRATRR
ncbi:DUF2087 domain-containing protein [Phaeobacter gallaeciensis]|uniref:DUF2087 domain-containing protein n=1 Tax=Phaeobacter gallaeciensis TaxID=60890 RepID=A0AAC9Z7D7_9RHOB|nr:DUF2087 domain-containing protein [Phaeobacter gallaeciensis]AHD08649.1 Uncharacterized protein in bacteria [Phaeobacter gallaeciensis DSM 26640]ATE91915.1 putative protein in bacteria [Phaeobacter gallaeciensis]ATE98261.1 putative protein in bacteria [Phaeobacter gallaeciensis]ATF00531.1 putative protein in bacteria [Phaeobacter gallaeciensis]ATF04962.1 putative protein in bacteria [Phaeobacter gallaeciensis]